MIPILLALVFAASPAPSRAESGWVILEEVRLPGGAPAGWQQTEIAFGKIRRETSQSPEVVIADPDAAVPVFRFLPAAKSWSGIDRKILDSGKTPGPFVEGIGVKGDELEIPAVAFRATGKKAKVGSWDAREFVSMAKAPGNMETRVWLADKPAGLPNDVVLSVTERVYARKGNAWEAYFRGLKALGGFPVRTVYRYEIGRTVTEVVSTVTRIDKVPLLESAFRVPAGSARADETRLPEPEPSGNVR